MRVSALGSLVLVMPTLLACPFGATPLAAAGPPAAQQNALRELHVVGLYEGYYKSEGKIHGGKARVAVKRPGKRVTLVLVGNDSITWEVTAAPGTELEKVILGGQRRQAVKGLPAKVEVAEEYAEGRRGGLYFCPRQVDSAQFRALVDHLYRRTGREVASFYGNYQAEPGRPIMVDRVQDDPRLSADYPKPTPLADLPKVTFKALRYSPRQRRFEGEVAYGDFTLGGPDLQSLKPLPGGVRRLTYDPAAGRHYGIAHSGLAEVDLEKVAVRKIEESLDVPRISWPSDLTFDTKRKRVLLLARGILYAYQPGTGGWSALVDGFSAAAITYHPGDDALYAVKGDREAAPALHRLNARGAVVKRVGLSGPVFPGLVSDSMAIAGVQLVAVGNHLVLLVWPSGWQGGDELGPARPFMYLIDPQTGKARLTWKGK